MGILYLLWQVVKTDVDAIGIGVTSKDEKKRREKQEHIQK